MAGPKKRKTEFRYRSGVLNHETKLAAQAGAVNDGTTSFLLKGRDKIRDGGILYQSVPKFSKAARKKAGA